MQPSLCRLLCMLIMLFSSIGVTVTLTLNMSNVPWIRKDRCTIRYALKESLKNYFTCEEVIANIPLCGRDIVVGYSHFPPYIFNGKINFEGILLGILNEALIGTCCFNCTKLKVLPPMRFVEKFDNWQQLDLIIPIEGSAYTREYFHLHFYPLIEQKSISFIGKTMQEPHIDLLNLLANTVVQSYSFLLLAMSMALAAGSIIWVLDTWYNKSQFPRNFPRGPFEGFWWAYVSMTTVGYGDRTPTSIAARIFAVIWILIGILFFNMYTATFTSILSTAMNREHKFELMGEKVGVLKGSTPSYIGISKLLSIPVEFENVSDMAIALKNEEIRAIAMEDRTAVYYLADFQNRIDDPGVQIQIRTPIEGSYIGFASVNWDLFKMLESFFDANRESIDVILNEGLRKQNVDLSTLMPRKLEDSRQPLSPFTDDPKRILLVCAMLCGLTVVIGIFGHLINQGVKRRNAVRRYAMKEKGTDHPVYIKNPAIFNSGYNTS